MEKLPSFYFAGAGRVPTIIDTLISLPFLNNVAKTLSLGLRFAIRLSILFEFLIC